MTDHPQAVMIFAAGFGTRMMPLTKDRPKPMVPVAGRPMIEYALEHARAMKPDQIVMNLHYKGQVLRNYLAQGDVQFIDEEPEILDTGGGLKNAASMFGFAPVFTLNPDVLWLGPNPLEVLSSAWDPHSMDALLLCIEPQEASGTSHKGDFALAADGMVTRAPSLIYGGAQIIKTSLLGSISERVFSLNLVWDQLIESGCCRGVQYPGSWCDIGSPHGLQAAERLLEAQDV